jgi:hypothetical protein
MATARVDLVDVRNGPAEVPMRIRVEPALAISGSVSASGGTPAGRALVTLYRFHGDDHAPPRPAKRVFVAEITAGADGSFRFDDLAREPYEIVAMHSMLGRGVRRVEPDGQDVTITLRRPSRAIGRVVRDGIGVVGVHVAIVPDLGQFAAAGDITELRGGETRTDRDGRFVVLLASHGSGELRVGDEGTGVRRVPLGPAESQPAVIDVGTIELSSLPPLTLVLEASEGCDLLLVGPAGRTGMTVVRSTRVGPAMYHAVVPEAGWWNVVAACNGRERAVVPANIEVDGRARDPTIRLTWPR